MDRAKNHLTYIVSCFAIFGIVFNTVDAELTHIYEKPSDDGFGKDYLIVPATMINVFHDDSGLSSGPVNQKEVHPEIDGVLSMIGGFFSVLNDKPEAQGRYTDRAKGGVEIFVDLMKEVQGDSKSSHTMGPINAHGWPVNPLASTKEGSMNIFPGKPRVVVSFIGDKHLHNYLFIRELNSDDNPDIHRLTYSTAIDFTTFDRLVCNNKRKIWKRAKYVTDEELMKMDQVMVEAIDERDHLKKVVSELRFKSKQLTKQLSFAEFQKASMERYKVEKSVELDETQMMISKLEWEIADKRRRG